MAPYTRAKRFGSRQISYREDDTNSSMDDEDFENAEMTLEDILPLLSRDKRSGTSRSPSQQKRLNSSAKKRKANQLIEQKKEHENDHPVLRLGGNVPCWQHLPYHILASIFQFSNCPPCGQVKPAWLIQIALLCKSFAEPALSALYFKLDFSSIRRAAKLTDLLKSQNTDSYLNYRGKVKWLVLEVTMRNLKQVRNRVEIIALTPQLRGIEIRSHLSNFDGNWSQLLPNMEANQIRLRDWRWTDCTAFSEGHEGRTPFNCAYPTAATQTLERVLILRRAQLKWEPHDFAKAINDLPRLKHLTFNLTIARDPELLLPLLSVNLESLRLVECTAIFADTLALCLATWGRELRFLNLDGLDPQSQPVMANLARSCPQLQELIIDFFSSWDSPSPTKLENLRPDEIPTWPESLQRLTVLQWGGWSVDYADAFFSSLVDSAVFLPDLRYIRIRASLGESGWKSRVHFREKWTRRFSHVFLRKSEPPNPHLQSLSAYQAFKIAQEKLASESIAHDSHPAIPGPSSTTPRKSGGDPHGNVGSEPGLSEINTKLVVDENSQIPGNRRSRRLRQHAGNSQRSSPSLSPPIRHRRRRRRRARGSDSDSSSEDSALEDEVERDPGGADETLENLYIQGLCDVVDTQFDNLRPSDEQLRESDFLNEAPSDDEDWHW